MLGQRPPPKGGGLRLRSVDGFGFFVVGIPEQMQGGRHSKKTTGLTNKVQYSAKPLKILFR
jgi:hypothetical protein